MDPELQLLIGLMSIAVTILIGAVVGAWTIRRVGKDLREVVKAIHDDIRHSQEKLEKKIVDTLHD